MSRCVLASSSLSLFFLSSHIGWEAREDPPPYFLVASFLCSLLSFSLTLPLSCSLLRGKGVEYVIAFGLAAWAVGELLSFSVAFAFSPLLLFPIQVAHGGGVVLYDPNVVWFLNSRAALYAAVRATGSLLVRKTSFFPRSASRLLPAFLGGVESMGMLLFGSGSSYRFGAAQFQVYSVLKTVVLVGVPYLEERATGEEVWGE